MLIDILFCYIAGGIACSMVCLITEYMSIREYSSGKPTKEEYEYLIPIFLITFLLWPILIIGAIALNIKEKFEKRK